MSQEEDKTALFTDILIYLGHPSTSLPELLITPREYGLLLGYKFNTHKSEILTLNYSPSQTIKEEFEGNQCQLNISCETIPKDLNVRQLRLPISKN